jgi:hypothetical protein
MTFAGDFLNRLFIYMYDSVFQLSTIRFTVAMSHLTPQNTQKPLTRVCHLVTIRVNTLDLVFEKLEPRTYSHVVINSLTSIGANKCPSLK